MSVKNKSKSKDLAKPLWQIRTMESLAWKVVSQEQTDALYECDTENEVLSLHAGNFARYRIKPSQFSAWQEVWLANP